MNTPHLLIEGWTWNPIVLATCTVAVGVYAWIFRDRARWAFFISAVALALLTLLSPLNALAEGVLFSAHMLQHILLLLIVSALVLLSLPRDLKLRLPGNAVLAVVGWGAGVGAMWFWHVPSLCNAAATSSGVHAFQTLSLLGMGAAFWWPILAPSEHQRLIPGFAVAYLFTACLACTALGIILTLTPVEVCPIFRAPLSTSTWAMMRERLTTQRDQQIGGLLMWVPMCLVYLAAIMVELGRWFGASAKPHNQTS